jgi:hypothetical protein
LSPADFSVYDEDLAAFPIDEVEAACLRLGQRERAEGETAFPPVAAIVKEIRAGVLAAKRKADDNRALEQINAQERHYREHPEEYVKLDLTGMLEELARKKALDPNAPRRKEVDTDKRDAV